MVAANAGNLEVTLSLTHEQYVRALEQINRRTTQTATRAGDLAKNTDKSQRSFIGLRGALIAGSSIYAFTSTIKRVGDMSSKLVNLENQVRVTSKIIGVDHVAAWERLRSTAQANYQTLDTTIDLFNRAAISAGNLGASTDDIFAFTEAMGRLSLVGGLSAQQTSSILLQIGQTLSKGKLEGQELRILREQGPFIVSELQRVLQTSDLSGIEAKEIFDAIITAGRDAEKQLDDITIASDKAFTAFKEAFSKDQEDNLRQFDSGLTKFWQTLTRVVEKTRELKDLKDLAYALPSDNRAGPRSIESARNIMKLAESEEAVLDVARTRHRKDPPPAETSVEKYKTDWEKEKEFRQMSTRDLREAMIQAEKQLQNETNEEVRKGISTRLESLDEEVQKRKATTLSLVASTSQAFGQLGDNLHELGAISFEQWKGFRIAEATASYALGVIGAWSRSILELGPIAGPIAAGTLTGLLSGVYATNVALIAGAQPGRAMGGSVAPGKGYQVGERAPEVMSVGGNHYLLPGPGGTINPNPQLTSQAGMGGGKVEVTINSDAEGLVEIAAKDNGAGGVVIDVETRKDLDKWLANFYTYGPSALKKAVRGNR